MTITVSSTSKCHSSNKFEKRDFEEGDKFQEVPVNSCEVVPPKFCQELLLKVVLY